MLPIFAAALLLATTPPQRQENGYEDYMRATEVISDPLFGTYTSWTPQQYEQMLEAEKADREYLAKLTPKERADLEKIDPEMFRPSSPTPDEMARKRLMESLRGKDYVTVNRLIVARYGRALHYIRQGNAKSYFDPCGKITITTLFPELAKFKSLSKLAAADAYVKFADGDSAGGVRTLIDAMVFARRIEKGRTLIENLVGIAMVAIVNASFNENLNSLSLGDCATISRWVNGALAEDPGVISVLNAERQFAVDSFDEIAEDPSSWLSGNDEDEEETAKDPMAEAIKKWGPAERARMRSTYNAVLDARFQKIVAPLRQPESTWYASFPKDPEEEEEAPIPAPTPEGVGQMLAEMSLPVYRQWVLAVLKTRAQIRLLGLHAEVNAYRWRYKKLPEKLEDAASSKLVQDPFANAPFAYEPLGTTYRLYSRGLPETGPIALRYRREAKEDVEDPLP